MKMKEILGNPGKVLASLAPLARSLARPSGCADLAAPWPVCAERAKVGPAIRGPVAPPRGPCKGTP